MRDKQYYQSCMYLGISKKRREQIKLMLLYLDTNPTEEIVMRQLELVEKKLKVYNRKEFKYDCSQDLSGKQVETNVHSQRNVSYIRLFRSAVVQNGENDLSRFKTTYHDTVRPIAKRNFLIVYFCRKSNWIQWQKHKTYKQLTPKNVPSRQFC